jgi:ubiquinone/menaquinone biosynthesis C-methylase UbiE
LPDIGKMQVYRQVNKMHERRYSAEIGRLRSSQRIALLEVERVVDLSLEGIHAVSAIDIGTGSGIFAEGFAKKGLDVCGIDPNSEMLKAAQSSVPQGKFTNGTAENLPFKDNAFDLVFLGHVLHESDDIDKAVLESRRCAKQRVVILEWPYLQEETGPPLEHRLKKEDILKAVSASGFSKIETIHLNHMVLFRLTI